MGLFRKPTQDDAVAAYRAGKLKKALKLFRMFAEEGDAYCQYLYGKMYYLGWGTKVDEVTALYWIKTAAENGVLEAMYDCGKMLFLGEGTAPDRERGAQWLLRAAAQGDEMAAEFLGEHISNAGELFRMAEEISGSKEAETCALLLYGAAASKGSPEAAEHVKEAIHSAYITGMVNKIGGRYGLALEGYEKAARLGYKDAQFTCGQMYYAGIGTDADLSKAFKWFKKAAEQGHVKAQFNCGLMYCNGEGTEKDMDEGMRLLRSAADQGDEEAQKLFR